jgi:hypothetical protein
MGLNNIVRCRVFRKNVECGFMKWLFCLVSFWISGSCKIGSGLENWEYGRRDRHADHVAPSNSKTLALTLPTSWWSLGRCSSLVDSCHGGFFFCKSGSVGCYHLNIYIYYNGHIVCVCVCEREHKRGSEGARYIYIYICIFTECFICVHEEGWSHLYVLFAPSNIAFVFINLKFCVPDHLPCWIKCELETCCKLLDHFVSIRNSLVAIQFFIRFHMHRTAFVV